MKTYTSLITIIWVVKGILTDMSLFYRDKRLLGVDISPSAVKILELSFSRGRYRVENYGVAPLAHKVIAESDFKDVISVGNAVALALTRSGTTLRDAAISVSGSSVITKIVQFSANISEEDMEAQARLEAARYVPFPIEEVSLDYEVLGPVPDHANKVNVLLVASRTENVEKRVDALKLGGLNTKVVDIEPYAVERACVLMKHQLPNNGENKVIVVIDIGSVITTITVLYDLQIIYTREEVFGGSQLTEAIQRRYSVTYEDAGKLKHGKEFPEGYEEDILDPFRDALLPMIQRSLQLFFSSSKFTTIDYILFAGGSAAIPGLQAMVKQQLGAESAMVNPFAEMDIDPAVDLEALQNDTLALLVCCGLALRSFS